MKAPSSTRPDAAGATESRRAFLTKLASVPGGVLVSKLGLLDQQASAAPKQSKQPNILFILVDEMRFPKVFPAGINTPDQFLQAFMPNTYQLLWSQGVKFANQHTGATACTPARGVLVSGLYSQQTWCALTILDTPTTTVEPQPPLNPAFPTYGKLLRQANYQTPYVGKWHLSIPKDNGLEDYGFDWITVPADPTGVNLQGTYGDINNEYLNDADIAHQASAWLSENQVGAQPWCLTVGFVNPHDKEFFPAGTEFRRFTELFANQPIPGPLPLAQWGNCPNGPSGGYSGSECVSGPSCAGPGTGGVTWDENELKDPPHYGYPTLPPNWESLDQLQANKPKFQTVGHEFMAMVWGGVTDDSTQTTEFTIEPYPQAPDKHYSPPFGIGTAPYSYWQRSLDSYTQILQKLDGHIGAVVRALSPEVAQNTVIIFTSDHGEYASAHGFVSGKTSSFYDEAVRVPLIVTDPSGRFTGDTDIVRNGLTSSADFLPLIVSLGYNGSRAWMKGDLLRLYKDRHDMLPMLRSAKAPGRQYVLFATDESIPSIYNYLRLPDGGYPGGHIIGIRTRDAKLAVYANWIPGTTKIAFDSTLELEFYDYSTPGGRAETDNRPTDPHARVLYNRLIHDLLPHELRAPLPRALQDASNASKARLVAYLLSLEALTIEDWIDNNAGVNILGYGLNVP